MTDLLEGLDAHEAFGHPLADHFAYLLEFPELFARSYAQWIVQGCGDERLHENLAATLDAGYPDQWTPDDFRPIAVELDRLFQVLKWH